LKKEYRLPTALLLLTVTVLFIVESSRTQKTDWSHSFYRDHKKPFGLFLFHEAFRQMWPEKNIEYIQVNFFEWITQEKDNGEKARNLIIINDSYRPDEHEAEALLEYVSQGNTVFISAENIGANLSTSLGIEKIHSSNGQVSIEDLQNAERESYSLEKYKRNFQGLAPYGSTFQVDEESSIEVLGKSIDGAPNYIRKIHGKGNFFINGTPAYFSNYGLLHAIDREYVYLTLSFLPEADFIWSDYTSTGFPAIKSPIRFLWSQPSLRWAYLLTLCFALLWVLFKAKRNQRIIPIIPAFKNESIEFLGILSKVYFRKADHTDLARKKVKYFFEQLRSQLHIQVSQQFDSELVSEVSSKSGYDLNNTQKLFRLIQDTQNTPTVSETQLIQLHRAISQFYFETKMYGTRTQ